MIASKRGVLYALIGLLSLYSCGLDGGARGTGITSTAQGNVAGVLLKDPKTASSLAGITVIVEPGGERSITDSVGTFLLRGSLDGKVTLLFSRPADAIHAKIRINLPAAGTLTLHNVRIDGDKASADSQDVDFDGTIVGIDCRSQMLSLCASQDLTYETDDNKEDVETYRLRLGTSSVRDKNGEPVVCAELLKGESAQIRGIVNEDGSFGHARLVLE